jgi:hypothetical protein
MAETPDPLTERPHYLSRIDHNLKIRNRKQGTDIGKYSVVNRNIEHWNRLPAEILEPLPGNSTTFRKKVKEGDIRDALRRAKVSSKSTEVY